jgi:hypothetical protein
MNALGVGLVALEDDLVRERTCSIVEVLTACAETPVDRGGLEVLRHRYR